jgi:hypothetical protein
VQKHDAWSNVMHVSAMQYGVFALGAGNPLGPAIGTHTFCVVAHSPAGPQPAAQRLPTPLQLAAGCHAAGAEEISGPPSFAEPASCIDASACPGPLPGGVGLSKPK